MENYIYSLAPPQLNPADPVEIVVCAYQYRPGAWTAHGMHADLALSRTGIARVGTIDAVYNAAARAFAASDPASPRIAVKPVRYGAFLARRKHPGNRDAILGLADQDDASRLFFFPFHKLFSGSECLAGATLELRFAEFHRNEKLARIHTEGAIPLIGGFDVQAPPFTRDAGNDAGLAGLRTFGATTVLVPVASAALVAIARQHNSHSKQDAIARFLVPGEASNVNGRSNRFSSSFSIPSLDGVTRLAPEYAHIRLKVTSNAAGVQSTEDLGQLLEAEFLPILNAGGFEAAHFSDNTCDGVVAVSVDGLPFALPSRPAYSLVTAPDFLPLVDQTEITAWVRERPGLNELQFRQGNPWPLSEARIAANLSLPLPGAGTRAFDADDTTMTAIVSPRPLSAATALNKQRKQFVSTLPDAAANYYEPGWDVARSQDADGHLFLTTFGLGSPFPEDAKLCAALNSFWPAAAPDASRTFMQSGYADRHAAVRRGTWPASWQSARAWGCRQTWLGRRIRPVHRTGRALSMINFASLDRSDYVSNALEGMMGVAALAHIDSGEMIARMTALQRVIKAVPPKKDFVSTTPLWLVSAQGVADWSADPYRTGTMLQGAGFRYVLALPSAEQALPVAGDLRRFRQPVDALFECEISAAALRFRMNEGPWTSPA